MTIRLQHAIKRFK